MTPDTKTSKSQPLVGLILTALAAVLLAGLSTFAGPCEDHVGNCVWAARATFAIGVVIAILAIVRIFEMDEGERRGLSLACALLGFLVAVISGPVIALCSDAAMPCNASMHPFITCVGIAIGLVGTIDLARRLLALVNSN